MRRTFLHIFMVIVSLAPLFVGAQDNNSLPMAATLEVMDARAAAGETIVYDQASNTYSVSQIEKDPRVYGVTAVRPALVFATASGTIPVVSEGVAKVQVTAQEGPIARGDLLVTSNTTGTAMRAVLSDNNVFAIALEPFGESTTSATGTISVSVGVKEAKALQDARRITQEKSAQLQTGSSTQSKQTASYIRMAIAAVLAVGGLLFTLYSFRTTIAKGVTSIGRNPRAKTSIMTLAIGNIIFALVLCAVVIFVAVAVLILPVG